MEEKIMETIVTTFTKSLIDESKAIMAEIYDKSYDEIKQFIGTDLKKYLTKQRDKYSHIKTLLRGNTPVYLYDVYYPLKLKNDSGVISTDSISELAKRSNCITIIGDAGSGKSTLIKHLFLNSIIEKTKIPLLIELRYLNDDTRSLEEYIKDTISTNKISINYTILERFMEKGKFTFFLDGYDELDETTKKRVTKQINDFVNIYDKNLYILTSRPYSNIEHFPLFLNLHMKSLELNSGEIKGFIYKQLVSEVEIANKIITSIEQSKSMYIESFLKNPLLLTLYILTFQSYASIPDKKFVFYRRVVNALFSEHDSKTKLGFVREKECGLNQEQFEHILKSFSFISYFASQFNFDRDYVNHKLKIIKMKKLDMNFDNNKFITDLKSAIALWVDDNGQLAFAHRSIQEYFTALFIKELQPEQNKQVYDKIIARFEKFNKTQNKTLREVENLLTLLSEMDEFNYYSNYYLPVLKELKEYLGEDKYQFERKFVDFFLKGVEYKNIRNEEFNIKRTDLILKDHIYKTIYVHIDFTRPLHAYLRSAMENKDVFSILFPSVRNTEDSVSSKRRKTKNPYCHAFKSGISDELFNILYTSQLIQITANYNKFLDNEIDRVSLFLNNTIDTEKDIIDLI